MCVKYVRLVLLLLLGSATEPTFVDSRKLNYHHYGPGVHEIFTYSPGAPVLGSVLQSSSIGVAPGIVNGIVTDPTSAESGIELGIGTGPEATTRQPLIDPGITGTGLLESTMSETGTGGSSGLPSLVLGSISGTGGTIPIIGTDLAGIVTTRKPLVDSGNPDTGPSISAMTIGEVDSSGTSMVAFGGLPSTSLGSGSGTETDTSETDLIGTPSGTVTTRQPLIDAGITGTGTPESTMSETGIGSSSGLPSIVLGSLSGTGGSIPIIGTDLAGIVTTRKPLVDSGNPDTEPSISAITIGDVDSSGTSMVAFGGLPSTSLGSASGTETVDAGITGTGTHESTMSETGTSGSSGLPSIVLGTIPIIGTDLAGIVTTRKPLVDSGNPISVITIGQVDSLGTSMVAFGGLPSTGLGSASGTETDTSGTDLIDSSAGTVTTRKPLVDFGNPGTGSNISVITINEASSSGSSLGGLPSIGLQSVSGAGMEMSGTDSIHTSAGTVTTRKPVVNSGNPDAVSSISVILIAEASSSLGTLGGSSPVEPSGPIPTTGTDSFDSAAGPVTTRRPLVPPSSVTATGLEIPIGSLLGLANQFPPNPQGIEPPPSHSSSSTTNTNNNNVETLLSSLYNVHATIEAVNQQLESDINSANLLNIETQPDIDDDREQQNYHGAQQPQVSYSPKPPYENGYYRMARSHRIRSSNGR